MTSWSYLRRRGLLVFTLLSLIQGGFASEKKNDWFDFAPPEDTFSSESAIDLRFLNEQVAGEHGFIGVKDGNFIRKGDGEALRFWAVNGPPHELQGQPLRNAARTFAKYGVNLVRVHGGYFNEKGDMDLSKVQHAFEIVSAMKAEGIYTHFSIYFPLWLTPQPDSTVLKGYNGRQHPFAALFFDPAFQEQYRTWWKALLTTVNRETGKALVDEPAVAGLEMQNEDSFFFWTFAEGNIPDPELRILESQFGRWLQKKYGTLESTLDKWHGHGVSRDNLAEGRIGFRQLWQIFSEKSLRDQDTAEFLLETQTTFYRETHAFLRKLGFKGVITASNWSTASPEVFGPLEKLSYAVGEFIDRHGYFSCNQKGPSSEWSIRDGHTYSDRSALRFDPEDRSKPRQFVHPAMDVHYNGMPSMISETTWTRPNRFRSEAPLYLAVYGALQHSDAIVHFAFDGARWAVKPGFWMQPWTLMSPAMMGQFPAAALIYRRALVRSGEVVAKIDLSEGDLRHLKGTPLPQEAALDELRLKDVPSGAGVKPGQRLDPLLHYVGRTDVTFSQGPSSTWMANVAPLVDHTNRIVRSSTGELALDYEKGVLTVNAPQAQGCSGALFAAGRVETKDLVVQSELELGHIVLVALDDVPLGRSTRLLLQVMSEEQPAGFQVEPVSAGVKRITSIGHDPWQVKELAGEVRLKRTDASSLKVTALDFNGYPVKPCGTADRIQLEPRTIYYLLSR